jgi:hypothetical protein
MKHIFTFRTKLHGVTSQGTVSSVQTTAIISIAGKIFASRSEEVTGEWQELRSDLHGFSLPWLMFCMVFLCPSSESSEDTAQDDVTIASIRVFPLFFANHLSPQC